jgi:hypothetical protein
MKKIELLYFTVAKKLCVNCSTLSSSFQFLFNWSNQVKPKVGGLDVETNRDRDRERPTCRD